MKKALSIKPNNIHALVNYANLKRDRNEYDESIKLYEKAYSIDEKISKSGMLSSSWVKIEIIYDFVLESFDQDQ